MKCTIKRDVVLEYLKRFSSVPSLTLARKLYSENKAVFRDVEDARTFVRKYRGKHGEMNRKKTACKQFFNSQIVYELPEPETRDAEPYKLSDGTWLVLADVHIPFHSKSALIETIKYVKNSFNTGQISILLLGDILDHYQLSNFVKDPRAKNLAYELECFKTFILWLRQELKPNEIVFKLGNHDYRYEKYLFQKAPELLDIPSLTFESLIEAENLGITLVESHKVIDAGHLTILHGHEYKGNSANVVNPARGIMLKAKSCTLSAHNHRTSSQIETTIKGKQIASWTVGCLCELNPMYMPLNQWNHGFAVVRKAGQDFEVENKRLINGKIYD